MHFAITLDRVSTGLIIIAYKKGGTNIEGLPEMHPDLNVKTPIDVFTEITDEDAAEVVDGLSPKVADRNSSIEQVKTLYELFCKGDYTLLEINPIVDTSDNKLVAANAKLNFDYNAAFCQKEIVALRDPAQDDSREVTAAKVDLNYMGLDRKIGCMVNGAGLAMATMDIIKICEYRLKDFEIVAADYVLKVGVSNFKNAWERMDSNRERIDEYGLGPRGSLAEAVNAVISLLNMQPCEGTEVVVSNSRSHICLLSEVYSDNVKVFVWLSFGINGARDTAIKLIVRSDNIMVEHFTITTHSIYSAQAKESLWRMDLELAIVLISSTLSCIFVGLQLCHVQNHVDVLPFVSLTILVLITLEHLVPLLLNFEALFRMSNNSLNIRFGKDGWLEVNEVFVCGSHLRTKNLVRFTPKVRGTQRFMFPLFSGGARSTAGVRCSKVGWAAGMGSALNRLPLALMVEKIQLSYCTFRGQAIICII